MRRITVTGLFVCVALLLIPSTYGADLDDLVEEMNRLSESAGGSMGVAAIHLETGRAAYLNKTDLFPMASSYKVPIAAQLLHKVDEGSLSLTDMVEVTPGKLSPGSGTISRIFNDPGLSISIHNLLELMLLISDNSATDMCLEAAGGGDAVTARMKAMGIEDLRVDRSTLKLIADYVGVKSLPPRTELTQPKLRALLNAVSEERSAEAAKELARDPQDTSSPVAMGKLLAMIWRDEALSKESSALLRDIMTRCETGENRLQGLLPKGTVVAHKTGTIGGTTNDVGVITLPHDRGHVIVVAMVKDSDKEIPIRERAIAEVARAAHDFFLFNHE